MTTPGCAELPGCLVQIHPKIRECSADKSEFALSFPFLLRWPGTVIRRSYIHLMSNSPAILHRKRVHGSKSQKRCSRHLNSSPFPDTKGSYRPEFHRIKSFSIFLPEEGWFVAVHNSVYIPAQADTLALSRDPNSLRRDGVFEYEVSTLCKRRGKSQRANLPRHSAGLLLWLGLWCGDRLCRA